jgi:4-hydroxybenzoate polyprenyltransferase
MAMVWTTQIITGQFEWYTPLSLFTFFSTISVYTWHRIIGYILVKDPVVTRRSAMIMDYRQLMIALAILSIPVMIVLGSKIDPATLILFIPPGVLTILYTTPLFGKKRRLRDLPFLKVFIIALAWVWTSVLIPWFDGGLRWDSALILIFLEKCFFILGITIPFDIRDFKIDAIQNIKTIPQWLGIKRSKYLSGFSLLLCITFVLLLYQSGIYSLPIILALIGSYVLSIIIVSYASEKCHDYYFSGLLDSTILIQFLFVFAITSFGSFFT